MNNTINVPEVKAKITWINDDPSAAKKAAAAITIAECFTVHGLGVIEGPSGLFISMPQRTVEKNGETKYNEIAHPITSEMRKTIHDAVFTAYSQAMAISKQYKESISNQKIPEVQSNEPHEQGSTDVEEGLNDESESEDNDLNESDIDEETAPFMGQFM